MLSPYYWFCAINPLITNDTYASNNYIRVNANDTYICVKEEGAHVLTSVALVALIRSLGGEI